MARLFGCAVLLAIYILWTRDTAAAAAATKTGDRQHSMQKR